MENIPGMPFLNYPPTLPIFPKEKKNAPLNVNGAIQNPITIDDAIFNFIKKRNIESLKSFLHHKHGVRGGNLSSKPLDAEDIHFLSEALSVLKRDTYLEKLDFSKCFCDYSYVEQIKVCAAISRLLESAVTLKEINLRDNKISALGATQIFLALFHVQALTSINLGSNEIGVNDPFSGEAEKKYDAISALASVLKQNRTLKMIYFDQNNLDEECAKILASGVAKNYTLTLLDLSNNPIGNLGAASVFSVLEKNASLQTLNMNNCRIEGSGEYASVQFIGRMLTRNGALSIIRLCDNRVDNEGANSIASGLRLNTKLEMIDLRKNVIGAVGMTSFAQALVDNKTLRSLKLKGNTDEKGIDLNMENAQLLADFLKTHAFAGKVSIDVLKSLKEEKTLLASGVSGPVSENPNEDEFINDEYIELDCTDTKTKPENTPSKPEKWVCSVQ